MVLVSTSAFFYLNKAHGSQIFHSVKYQDGLISASLTWLLKQATKLCSFLNFLIAAKFNIKKDLKCNPFPSSHDSFLLYKMIF